MLDRAFMSIEAIFRNLISIIFFRNENKNEKICSEKNTKKTKYIEIMKEKLKQFHFFL